MTNANTAIGAVIPRYKIGYRSDEWGMRSSTPGGVSDPAGQWVRYDDHIAALASAAAPAEQPDTAYAALPMQFACSGVHPVYSADQMRAFADGTHALRTQHIVCREFLDRMLSVMEGVIDVADRQTDEFEALRSCVVDLTLMLFKPEALRASRGQAPAGAASVTDAMVLAALQVQYPAGYDTQLRHPANGPKTSARTEAEIDLARRMIAAALATHSAPVPTAPSVLEDAARYRWLRDEGFTFADVDLGTDSDGDNFVAYRIRFHLPEPAHSKFEDDEWTGQDIDAAIDAARKQGANHD